MKLFIQIFKHIVLFLVLVPALAQAQLNGSYVLSGQVKDDTGQSIIGATVKIKGTSNATATDTAGRFSLTSNVKLPYTLLFTAIGFQPQEFLIKSVNSKLNVQLNTQSLLVNEVVVTASRKEEKLMRSPVAIEKLDITALKSSPAPSFYDALENVKGVQMTTSSLTLKVPNTRGFNSPNNFRFMQLVDGVDMQSATLGVPLGNAIGPTELDIASIEITPGAASALYGMNALNGLANLTTKDPFKYQGLSFYHRTGVNHVDGIGQPPSILTEDAIRYDKAFNDKFAFKVNASYLQGVDWQSNTIADQNPNNLKTANPLFPELNNANAAYDGWNKYGDDALAGSNTVTIKGLTLNGATAPALTVARTGYNEVDLVDPKVSNLKLDGTLSYKLSPTTVLSYSYRYGRMDGVFQRGNKIDLNGATVQNHKIELKGKDFLVRAYVSLENTGDSYNVKPLADNLDLNHASNSAWGTTYKNALVSYGSAHGGLTSANFADANNAARTAADLGRVEPGTAAFNALKNTIIGINNWDIKSSLIPTAPVTGGAALIQQSRMYNGEAQWDLSDKVKVFDLLIGGDARLYQIIPDGNNFVDFTRSIADRNTPEADGSFGKDVYYKKVGAFTQVTKTFFEDKLKLFGSIRFDYNPYFDPKFTPRLAAVYSVDDNNSFRFTYQVGYRFPSLFEALSYVNNGRVKRVGSLPFINDGLGYLGNSYTQASVATFNAAVNAAPGAASGTDATALANRNLLQVADLPAAKPEQITSYEVGYKSIFADNKVFFDIDAYTNTYHGFLGQEQVYVPNSATIGSDAAVLAMLDINRDPTTATANNAASAGQARYRVYTNAKNVYHNYGSSAGLTYNFYKRYTVSGNVSFNKMESQNATDVFVTGFNTPQLSTNLSFGNREIIKNVGFNVVYKWQQSFLWQSPLVNGTVPEIRTFDAQVTFKIPEYNATIKAGGTDLLNRRYIQYAGGPTLGALYYASITLDGLLSKPF